MGPPSENLQKKNPTGRRRMDSLPFLVHFTWKPLLSAEGGGGGRRGAQFGIVQEKGGKRGHFRDASKRKKIWRSLGGPVEGSFFPQTRFHLSPNFPEGGGERGEGREKKIITDVHQTPIIPTRPTSGLGSNRGSKCSHEILQYWLKIRQTSTKPSARRASTGTEE